MSKKNKTLKCEICKKVVDFYIHICKRGYQEYLGCKVCDDTCDYCKRVIKQ